MGGKRLYRDRLGVIICFLFGLGHLFQSSCATLGVAPKAAEPAVSEEEPAKPLIFQSEEYILYLREFFRGSKEIMGD
jgi:hypothetical protein